MSVRILGKLPDPFLKEDGTRMTPDEWYENRSELFNKICMTEFGGIPPKPEFLEFMKNAIEGGNLAEHLKINPYPELDIDSNW